MKITEVRVHLMQAEGPPQTGWSATGKSALATSRNWMFVTIATDAGLTGVGEGSGWPRAAAAAAEDLGRLLMGETLVSIERLHQRLRTAVMGHGLIGTVGGGAIAALDMALWDLRAQALGIPVSQLLGGPVRSQVPYYTHAATPEAALAAVARGITGIKVGGLKQVVERAYAVRAAVGPDVDLMVDLHGPPWLNAADAVAIGRELEPLGLLFLEEPVAPDDLGGWRRVRDRVALPLACGERLSTLAEMLPFIHEGLIDILQPDTGRFGGLSQMRKLAAMAEAHSLLIAPHSGSLGPVAEFAAVHLLSAIPNALMMERMEPDWALRDSVLQQPLVLARGAIEVPTSAGLGTSLRLEQVRNFPSQCNVAIATGGYHPGTDSEGVLYQARRPRARMFSKTLT